MTILHARYCFKLITFQRKRTEKFTERFIGNRERTPLIDSLNVIGDSKEDIVEK